MVEELKAAVPRGYRRWSQERRAWFVHEWYWSEAREVFETYGLLGPDEAAKMAEARKKEAAALVEEVSE